MHATRNRIAALVTRIQDDFLGTPGLALTPADAARRFRIDADVCRALLDVLVDARVLTNRAGTCVRYFPPSVTRRTAKVLQHAGRRGHRSGFAPQAA